MNTIRSAVVVGIGIVGMGIGALAVSGCSSRANGQSHKQTAQSSPAPGAPAAAASRPAVPGDQPRRTLQRQRPLPEAARKALHSKMIAHGDDMESLLWATLMLDYDTASAISEWIQDRPKLERPRQPGGKPAFADLPESFFVLQDQLDRVAYELSLAASNRDDAQMARLYGRMAETCIRCHALYLQLPPAGP
jgi:hypothetical protein